MQSLNDTELAVKLESFKDTKGLTDTSKED